MTATTESFLQSFGFFRLYYQLSVECSGALFADDDDERAKWAFFNYIRLLLHAQTLQKLCMPILEGKLEEQVDHHAVLSLARNICDASVMIHYLTERSLSKDDWRFRQSVLLLHDLTARYRIEKSRRKFSELTGDSRQLEAIEESISRLNFERETLRIEIQRSPLLKALDQDRQDRILSGQEVYVNGVRGAVREAGHLLPKYERDHVFLSSHVHAHPSSYILGTLHGIDYKGISQGQIDLCAIALDVSGDWLERALQRMNDVYATR
jgi:hypothetical protein